MKELHIYTYDVPFGIHSKEYCEEHLGDEGRINTYDVSMFSVWEYERYNDVYIHWKDKDKYCYTSIKAMLDGTSPYFANKRITTAHNMQRLFNGYIWGPLHKNDAV